MCVLSAVLFMRIRPMTIEPNVRAVVSKQQGRIESIDTPRNVQSSKTFLLNAIDFENGQTLVHRRLGPLGYNNDFFIDFEARMNVEQEKTFLFRVTSDDGFRLWIDNQMLAEWLGDRPVATSTATIKLAPGEHHFRMSYFQGYGNLGLRATYEVQGEKSYLVGESSAELSFERFNN